MASRKQNEAQDAKTRYSRPQLTVYGSVRNLTGGSGGTNGDGALAMTRL